MTFHRKNWSHYREPRARREDDPFVQFEFRLPVSLEQELRSLSDYVGLPISRLITIAIDNELSDSKNPFNYPVDFPDVETKPFKEYQYATEASRIVEYLRRFRRGAGREMLLLARRDMGIQSRETFMMAYRELLFSGVIEEYRPPRVHTKFGYPPDYRYARLVTQPMPKNPK